MNWAALIAAGVLGVLAFAASDWGAKGLAFIGGVFKVKPDRQALRAAWDVLYDGLPVVTKPELKAALDTIWAELGAKE